jgi:hypothetical protein
MRFWEFLCKNHYIRGCGWKDMAKRSVVGKMVILEGSRVYF